MCRIDVRHRQVKDREALARTSREVRKWIAWNQPCSYHTPGGEAGGDAALQRIYLECSR
jgi:hypothetical protein